MYRTGQCQGGEKRCGRCLWGYLYSWFCFPLVSMFSQQCYDFLPCSYCLKKTQGFGIGLHQTYILSLCLVPLILTSTKIFRKQTQWRVLTFLTGHLHNISRDNFSGLDHLHTLSVRTVNLAHLRLIFLESLNGIFCVTLLWHTWTRDTNSQLKNNKLGK